MTTPLKATCVAVTVVLVTGAFVVGGGVPLSPAEVSRSATRAAKNTDIAVANTERAARDTQALASIADNVHSQLETSRRLLETQLEIERSSTKGLRTTRHVAGRIGAITEALVTLEKRLRSLAALSSQTTRAARRSREAAVKLQRLLGVLQGRYDVVVKESRELNRKARGYEKVKP